MRMLITGARGFIGENLMAALACVKDGRDRARALGTDTVWETHAWDDPPQLLMERCARAQFVVHLAGVNRPETDAHFVSGNVEFTRALLGALRAQGNRAPVLLASSIQAEMDRPYGRSKRAAEALVFDHARETGAPALVYRLPNVFGKWARPNYNSAIATFCHNTARGLPIRVTDPAAQMRLAYIDDVVDEILRAAAGAPNRQGEFCAVEPVHQASLGHVAGLIRSFPSMLDSLGLPDLADPLTRKLFATYLSCLPPDRVARPRTTHADARGGFAELLRTECAGQVSVNVAAPGQLKGNHWHHTKHEKFIVVSGEGAIRLRRIGDDRVIEQRVSGRAVTEVIIPPGYTHNIENLGQTDLVTVMWASEPFDPQRPDTYYEQV